MKNLQNEAKSPQGADLEEVDISDIKKWLDNDLHRAIGLLKAMYDDPNIKNMVAEYMQGRVNNWKAAQKAKMTSEGLAN